ncbi:unnamed protein product [Prunus armeniaca]
MGRSKGILGLFDTSRGLIEEHSWSLSQRQWVRMNPSSQLVEHLHSGHRHKLRPLQGTKSCEEHHFGPYQDDHQGHPKICKLDLPVEYHYSA